MNENLYKTLSELIEHSSHASELLINGEIALNNGEFENFELGGEIVDTIDLPFDFSIIQKREKKSKRTIGRTL